MRFDRPLLKLPIRFCAETLAAEVRAMPAEAWLPHPSGFVGNEAVPLVTPAGQVTNDFAGPMGPTAALLGSPYMRQAMAEIDAVWGRGRLMGLGAGAEVPEHVDANYYWRTHIRLHIAAVTNPDVAFSCGDQTVTMAPGECWIFDTFRPHRVVNAGTTQRVHMVFDTVGGEHLWELVEAASSGTPSEARLIEPDRNRPAEPQYEQVNYPPIMSPWELKCHVDELIQGAIDHPALAPVRRRLDRLIAGWTAAWTRFETDDAGLPTYLALQEKVRSDLMSIGGDQIMMHNGYSLFEVLRIFVIDNLIASRRARRSMERAALAGAATAA